MKIRAATPEDIAAFIELERASSSAAHWTADRYREAFRVEGRARRVLVAAESEEGLIVGFLVVHRVDPEWELENIVVASAERAKGIGKKLLEHLADVSRRSGGRAIFLEVRQSNEAARRLYARVGFLQTGIRRNYYSDPEEDAVLYRLDLQ